MLGLEYNPKLAAELRHNFGLDKPLPVQYFIWLKNILCGNLGISSMQGAPVVKLFFKHLPYTLLISFTALVLSFMISTLTGIIAAIKKNSIIDYILSAVSLIGISIPDFWICFMIVAYFKINATLFGTYIMACRYGDPRSFTSHSLKTFIFPILVLIITTVGPNFKIVRGSMLDILKLDYITNARSKGLSERKVIFKHGFRNALLPFITYLGLTFPTLITGTFIIETVFGIPGVGFNYINSVFSRDFPYLMGTMLLITMFIIVGNLLADVLYALADPRIKYN
jgi:peptide/nickel transport system permease protein